MKKALGALLGCIVLLSPFYVKANRVGESGGCKIR